VLVQIVGEPLACATCAAGTWRSVAGYVAQQLALRFGDALRIVYYDLFDEGCPALPEGVQLPLVLVDGEVVSSGGKLRVPMIRQAVEARLRDYLTMQNSGERFESAGIEATRVQPGEIVELLTRVSAGLDSAERADDRYR
jgi:hypothetical protein